jgi:uncharacterized protein HemY
MKKRSMKGRLCVEEPQITPKQNKTKQKQEETNDKTKKINEKYYLTIGITVHKHNTPQQNVSKQSNSSQTSERKK